MHPPRHVGGNFASTSARNFSPNRPHRWPASSVKAFEVYHLGNTDTDIREGQDFPKLWARWHYDWSTPGSVTLTVVESDAMEPGGFMTLTARSPSLSSLTTTLLVMAQIDIEYAGRTYTVPWTDDNVERLKGIAQHVRDGRAEVFTVLGDGFTLTIVVGPTIPLAITYVD